MEAAKILQLKDVDRIAISKTRHCYLHPEDPDKVIKIVVRKPRYPWLDDANMKEWKYYIRLKKMYLPLDFITTYYGFIETNLGRGLVSGCVRDYDGKISVRMQSVVDHDVDYDIKKIEMKLQLLSEKLLRHNVQLFDLNRFNLLIQRQKDGEYKPISIDVKGPYSNNEFIPFSSYINYFSIMKLKRRTNKLIDIIRAARLEQEVMR